MQRRGHSRARKREQSARPRKATRSRTECTPTLVSANHPGIMQKPGIPAQQMQRTDSRERACGSGTGQTHSRSTRNASQPCVARRRRVSDERRRTLLLRDSSIRVTAAMSLCGYVVRSLSGRRRRQTREGGCSLENFLHSVHLALTSASAPSSSRARARRSCSSGTPSARSRCTSRTSSPSRT